MCPKVSWKFNDSPGYVRELVLNSSVSIFSVYLFCVERAVACDRCEFRTNITVYINTILIIFMLKSNSKLVSLKNKYSSLTS